MNQPTLSVNKFAEYLVRKAARQRQLLRERKYPNPDFSPGMYHREASDAIMSYIANGAIDTSPLENAVKTLNQTPAEKVGTARRIGANIDTVERFMNMLDDVDLKGAEPELASHTGGEIVFHGVRITVRPEIILSGIDKKGRTLKGAIKFHFSKSAPMNEETAGYVSAMVQEYLKNSVLEGGEILNPAFCMVIDTASETVFPGIKATTQRLKDVQAECENIAALWPSI